MPLGLAPTGVRPNGVGVHVALRGRWAPSGLAGVSRAWQATDRRDRPPEIGSWRARVTHTGSVTCVMPPWAGAPVAPFTTRLVACLLDAAVYLVVQAVLTVLAAVAALVIVATVPTPSMGRGSSTPYDPDLSGVLVLSTLVVLLALAVLAGFGYLYEVHLALSTGATWSKRATGIRVASVAPHRG